MGLLAGGVLNCRLSLRHQLIIAAQSAREQAEDEVVSLIATLAGPTNEVLDAGYFFHFGNN
jgi:hypothetical protein